MAGCQQGAMSVGGEQARRVCVQVHSWGLLSTGGSADRHCTSSHDTVGADCQREATPASAAPARLYMPADTRPGLLVDRSPRRQTLCQVARVFVQIRVQGRLLTGGSVGRL